MQHKEIKHYEDNIDYANLIIHSFKEYSLKRMLKELEKNGEMAVKEEYSIPCSLDTS